MRKIGIPMFILAVAGAASAQTVDDAALKQIHVTSGRSSVWEKFNQPAVQVWLPPVENSAYADFEIADPVVLDAKGRPVELAVEPGLYEPESARKEFRLLPMAEPSRMKGKVRVRYPVRIRPAEEGEPVERLTEPAFKVDLPRVFVEEWRQVEVTYDLPIAALLPQAQKGEFQPAPEILAQAPEGSVEVVVKK